MKTLIIPIGIVGCGKSTIGSQIIKSFPSTTSIQADDIIVTKGAKKPQVFIDLILNSLNQFQFIYCDRNNHLTQHRTQLITSFKNKYNDGKVIVLDWKIETLESKKVLDACFLRIKNRSFHKTLPNTMDDKKLAMIINRFIKERDKYLESEGGDYLIEMDYFKSPDEQAEFVISNLQTIISIIEGK